ncbi:MAG: glycerol-3-phosphate acyltransferase [Chloroflexota bacterium]
MVARLSTCAFLAGSIPFSVWVGRWFLQTDIRHYGDANPGATNVYRAGGRGVAIAALLLDFLKGSIPVGVAYYWAGTRDWPMVVVALMPVLGHAFSPFLGFRGGKAVAVTGGIWCGLTLWEGPTIGGLALGLAFYWIATSGWAVLSAMSVLLLYFLVIPPIELAQDWIRPDTVPLLLWVWVGNMVILVWKHWKELKSGIRLRRKGSG